MGRVRELILDFFFPNRCPLCGNVIRWDRECCNECIDNLPETGDELCLGCGNIKENCQCGKGKFLFRRCYAAYYYSGTARSAVLYLKDTKNSLFPRLTAEKICRDMEKDDFIFKADYVVPVPLSRRKLNTRGYNQAAVLGQALADRLDIPVRENLIMRRDTLTDQHSLSSAMRSASAKALYYAEENDDIKGKTIILCDDVITTGSTINECARLLIEMGADMIIAAAAATTE